MKQLRKEGFSAYDASVAPQGSAWDRACELYAQLTAEGAADEINKWLTTLDSDFYFSYPCAATKEAEEGSQEPVTEIMEKLFQRSSKRMGSFEGTCPDGAVFTKEWQKNDGLVNTISARAPSHSKACDFYDGVEIKKGIWYVMPEYTGDHMSLQGGLTIKNNITDFYIKHLNMINTL